MLKKHIRPDFTKEQLEWLAHVLRPQCCHVTGMHSPVHFRDNPAEFCELQQSDAWERAVAALGLDFDRAVSDPACYSCNDSRRKAAEERSVAGLPDLLQVLRSCAVASRNPSPRRKSFSKTVRHGGTRWHVTFDWLAHVYDHGEVSRVLLRLPRYDPVADIPPDGYAVMRGHLTDAEKDELLGALREAGAQVLDSWGGGEHFSVALKSAGAVQVAESVGA